MLNLKRLRQATDFFQPAVKKKERKNVTEGDMLLLQIMFQNYACQSRVPLFSPFVNEPLYHKVNPDGFAQRFYPLLSPHLAHIHQICSFLNR